MILNAMFPTRHIGNDPGAIKAWASAAEELDFHTIEVADHVFGAEPRDGWQPIYDATQPFHETFVTLGFLAAVTQTIQLSSGILILPQRQTGLVAKQAAEVDVLSGGRLRLGIGVGWNPVEYAALGQNWHQRGARQAEQVELLRQLWTGESVSFAGRFESVDRVNLMPPPVQRPIPIWFGGSSEPVIRRAARLGDGWMPILSPDEAPAKLTLMQQCLAESGRDRAQFGIEAWMRMDQDDPDLWAASVEQWRALGADYLMLYPMFQVDGVDGQIELLRRFKAAVQT